MNDALTPREFCSRLAGTGTGAEPDNEFYAAGGLSDGRSWFADASDIHLDRRDFLRPDEPMAARLWIQVCPADKADDDLWGPGAFLESCTHEEALTAIRRADAGDYSMFRPFLSSLDAVPPRAKPGPEGAGPEPAWLPRDASAAVRDGRVRGSARPRGRQTAERQRGQNGQGRG